MEARASGGPEDVDAPSAPLGIIGRHPTSDAVVSAASTSGRPKPRRRDNKINIVPRHPRAAPIGFGAIGRALADRINTAGGDWPPARMRGAAVSASASTAASLDRV